MTIDKSKIKINLNQLEKIIEYRFSDKSMLQTALTHPSYRVTNIKSISYERLEFLGDAVLGCVISTWVYQSYPHFNEGQMSKLTASLISRKTCHKIGRSIKLNEFIMLSNGEIKNRGLEKLTTIANCLEALIGAIYLDSNMTLDKPKKFILKHWQESFRNPETEDYKSKLQEITQSKEAILPEYIITDISGSDHEPQFNCTVKVKGMPDQIGTGDNKKASQQNAAKQMIERFQEMQQKKK